ncbi:MAG: type IV pili twitching motility protein PilT, partial [Aquificaceae bacterium]
MLQLILKKAIEMGASDIHLKTGSSPVFRVKKKLQRFENFPVLDERIMELIVREILEKNRKKMAE